MTWPRSFAPRPMVALAPGASEPEKRWGPMSKHPSPRRYWLAAQLVGATRSQLTIVPFARHQLLTMTAPTCGSVSAVTGADVVQLTWVPFPTHQLPEVVAPTFGSASVRAAPAVVA